MYLYATFLAAALLPVACPWVSHASEFATVEIKSSVDGAVQRALWWAPKSASSVPLVVALHTWSGFYDQSGSAEYFKRAQARGWAAIHPDFRGENTRPAACGSDLAVADILDAVSFARKNASIDPTRIYLVGASGGGHAALLTVARHPEVWAGVSAWCAITDLTEWYAQNLGKKSRYPSDMIAVFGGPPTASPAIAEEYRRRSSLGQLGAAAGVAIDINNGNHDPNVPMKHALLAFNELAKANGGTGLEPSLMAELQKEITPPSAGKPPDDPLYSQPVLFRRQSGPVRLTIFDGGHNIFYDAAFAWLARQAKPPVKPATQVP